MAIRVVVHHEGDTITVSVALLWLTIWLIIVLLPFPSLSP